MFRLIILSILILFSNNLSASAISHAPIGVMADHFHKKGEWMVSLRVTQMEMKKNILNGESISNDEILKQPNPYATMPMMMKMPMNLSVIPQKMTMKMIYIIY